MTRRMMAPVALIGGVIGLGVLAAGVFAGIGESSLDAVLHGLGVAVMVQLLLLIVWTVLAPASFIHWRYRTFGINYSDRREPWRDPRSVRSMRLLGLAAIFIAAPFGLMLFLELRKVLSLYRH